MTALGILSYGISITTLEEVFLHINKEFGMDLKKATGEVAEAEKTTAQELSVIEPASVQVVESDPYQPLVNVSQALNNSTQSLLSSSSRALLFTKITDTESESTERLISQSSFTDNIKALMSKRLTVYRRDWVGIVCEVFVPFVMVLIGCSLTKLYIP